MARQTAVGPFGRGGGFSLPIGRCGGGLSIGTVIFLVVIYLIFKAMGVEPMQIMEDGNMDHSGYEQSHRQNPDASQTSSTDQTTAFVKTVLVEREDTWQQIFQSQSQSYEDPTLVLFRGQTRSACGSAPAPSDPFYCPEDHKVYLDTALCDDLNNRFGASGDFAEGYVVAREVAQKQLGILPKFNEARQRMSEAAHANKMSICVELQADCFADIWGKYIQQKGILDAGDLGEALNAAQQIGDDTLQKRTQGYVVPDSFYHGTSAQRVKRFKQGFDSGQLSSCDTFSGTV